MQAVDEFRRALEQAGLHPPAVIPPGEMIRFPGVGKSNGNTSGWAKFFADGQGGVYGDWASELSENWHAARATPRTPAEREAHTRRIAEMQRIRHEEEHTRHAEAAHRAQSIWESAKAADRAHPYLKRKGIQPHGLRMDDEHQLIAPVMIGDTIATVQFISPDPTVSKKFLYGGASKDGYFFLGEQQDDQPILLCEGFATGASLFEAMGYLVVVAFSANNLLSVATQARQQFPTATILLCGDNDVRDDGKPNTGLLAATEAAKAIDGILAIPEVINNAKTDWNDVHVQLGLDAVSKAIEAVLTREDAATMGPPAAPDTPEEMPDEAPPDEGRPQEKAASVNEAPNPTPTSSGGDPGLTKELADMILRTHHFAQDAGGQLYVYFSGTYRPNGEERIAQHVKAILVDNGNSKRWSSHRAREVVEFIRVDAPRLWDRPPLAVINVLNGLLDWKEGVLRIHDPTHLTPVQLPVVFDPSARCPRWESFTARVLPADCQRLPFELIASAMRGDISDQKAVLQVGPGENGKSTLLSAIVAFLGPENVSSLALQRLEVDKFSAVRLLGKLANICADLPTDHLTSTSMFKAVTGGDPIPAERKFQSSFEFRPFARLMFSANHYPQSKDNSHAFFRRWLVVPFDTVIELHERIPHLAALLADPQELSGVLNRALDELPGLLQRGGFSQSETTQTALMEFREMTDPLAAWLDRHTLLSSDQMVTKKDLAIVYNAASEAAGRPPMTSKAFCAAVRRLRLVVKEAQRTVCGEVKHVFLGLGLRATAATSSPTTHDGSAHEPPLFEEDSPC